MVTIEYTVCCVHIVLHVILLNCIYINYFACYSLHYYGEQWLRQLWHIVSVTVYLLWLHTVNTHLLYVLIIIQLQSYLLCLHYLVSMFALLYAIRKNTLIPSNLRVFYNIGAMLGLVYTLQVTSGLLTLILFRMDFRQFILYTLWILHL